MRESEAILRQRSRREQRAAVRVGVGVWVRVLVYWLALRCWYTGFVDVVHVGVAT